VEIIQAASRLLKFDGATILDYGRRCNILEVVARVFRLRDPSGNRSFSNF
jgi:hypothetical protein